MCGVSQFLEENNIYLKKKNSVLVALMLLLPGLEVASYLIGKATSVTLVGLMPEPLQPILGTKVGGMVRKVCNNSCTGVRYLYLWT